jgi:peptide/nickel transport system permease protein
MSLLSLDRRRKRIDDLSSGTSLGHEAFRRMLRNPAAVTGGVLVVMFVLLAAFARVLTPHDPFFRDSVLLANLRPDHIPSDVPGYLLGSDNNGRDFFSRMLVGSQQTLIVGVVATLAGLAVGMIIGGLAGALGGWVDVVLMRFVDVLLSLPSLLLAVSIAALVAHGNQWTVIIAVAVIAVPVFARLLRGAMLAQRSSDHVLAATAVGVRRRTIVFRHMLPNSMAPVLVQATLTLATSILEAASLSFLGLGDPDPDRAEWGQMLSQSIQFFQIRPALVFYPALAIVVVALGFTLLGESMREALDPKNRR